MNNNSYYSGSSYYDEEVSMRSDPPIPTFSFTQNQKTKNLSGAKKATTKNNQTHQAEHSASALGVGCCAITSFDPVASGTTLMKHPGNNQPQQTLLSMQSNFLFEKSVDGKQPGSKRSQTSEKVTVGDSKNQIDAELQAGKGKGEIRILEKNQYDGPDGISKEKGGGDASLAGLKNIKVSDILQGNFAPIEIPTLEIPGTSPLVYNEPETLIAEINEKDEFHRFGEEEEFLMFTAEMLDFDERLGDDGPFSTLRWRERVRNFFRDRQPPPKSKGNDSDIADMTAEDKPNEGGQSPIDEVGSKAEEVEDDNSAFVTQDELVSSHYNLVTSPGLMVEISQSLEGSILAHMKVSGEVNYASNFGSPEERLSGEPAEDIVEFGVYEEHFIDLPVMTMPCIGSVQDLFRAKEMKHPPHVQLQPTRPVFERLSSHYVKEIETGWLAQQSTQKGHRGKKVSKKKKQASFEALALDSYQLKESLDVDIELDVYKEGNKDLLQTKISRNDALLPRNEAVSSMRSSQRYLEKSSQNGFSNITEDEMDQSSYEDDQFSEDKQAEKGPEHISIELNGLVNQTTHDGKFKLQFASFFSPTAVKSSLKDVKSPKNASDNTINANQRSKSKLIVSTESYLHPATLGNDRRRSAEIDSKHANSREKIEKIEETEEVQEAYGSVGAERAYITEDDEEPDFNSLEAEAVGPVDPSETTMYNPGEIERDDDGKVDENQTNAAPKQSKQNILMRKHMGQQNAKAQKLATNDSSTYVRRIKQPKLMDKQKMMQKLMNKDQQANSTEEPQ